MTHRTFHITIKREGSWLIVDIPELRERTQARTALGARWMARDLIALRLEIPKGSFDVVVDEKEEVETPRASPKNRRLRLSELWMDL